MGPVPVVGMGDHQQRRHFICYQVQDRIQVLTGGGTCSLVLCRRVLPGGVSGKQSVNSGAKNVELPCPPRPCPRHPLPLLA